MKNIIKFKVLPPNFDSKHAPITATFKSSFVKFGKEELLNHPKSHNWDNQGAVLFHSLLNQKAVIQFTEIISECGDKTLTVKRRGKVNKKPKKPWYSENCALLRKQFTRIAKLLQKDPKNPYKMGQYQKIKKSYKHMIKISKRHWEINNIQKLSEITENPKLFWSHLKSLRGAIRSSTPNVISPQQWFEHFSKLLYSENERKDDQELFLDNDTDRNIRNAILASVEILKGTTLLKSKKASGYDSISNEMIKASLPSSLSFLVTLFNINPNTQIERNRKSR